MQYRFKMGYDNILHEASLSDFEQYRNFKISKIAERQTKYHRIETQALSRYVTIYMI